METAEHLKMKVQAYSLISSHQPTLYFTPWSLDLLIRVAFQLHEEHYRPAAILAHWTHRSQTSHCHLCPTRYSYTPESSEACECKMTGPEMWLTQILYVWLVREELQRCDWPRYCMCDWSEKNSSNHVTKMYISHINNIFTTIVAMALDAIETKG